MASPDVANDPPGDVINALIGLLNQQQFEDAARRAEGLVRVFPASSVLWNILGSGSAQCGRLEQAAAAFDKACSLNPQAPEAHCNLGNVLQDLGQLDAAEQSHRHALALRPDFVDAHFNLASVLIAQGKPDAAVAAYRAALALQPDYIDAWINLGLVLNDLGRLDEAVDACHRALSLNPDMAQIYNNLGAVLRQQGKLDQALACYQRALALLPGYVEAHHNLGNVLHAQGKLDQAAACYRHALSLWPDYADAYCSLGNVYRAQGKRDQAIESYHNALTRNPGSLDALYNLGSALDEQGSIDQAIAIYRRVLALDPVHALALNGLGASLLKLGALDAADASLRDALALRPDFAEAHANLGNVHKERGDPVEAAAAFGRALAFRPDLAEAHYNLAGLLHDRNELHEALASLDRALASRPDYREAQAQRLHLLHLMGHWESIDTLDATCADLAAQADVLAPFSFLAMTDNPRVHLQFSRKWATGKYQAAPLPALSRPPLPQPRARPQRLRIGYFGADFHDHATLFLMAGLLREHDKARFEIFAYSYGHEKTGRWLAQARHDVDHFVDVSGQPSRAIAERARADRLDIAIDLKGYTQHTRSDLFQHRPAPIQISYLGYPGSMGADFIDYMIADSVVIPEAQRAFYSENVIFLPHCYQPNDNARPIAQTPTSRADFGLPADAFVFCCFNNSYKIGPREFDIWMRVLGRVEDSVLWLFKSNTWCTDNLRRHAEARGIAGDRLVFAERMDHADHLARHRYADVFVDTFNYNAHTTASDALWSGLPVVTRAGQQFAARVCASLLMAVGLPELITDSDAAYEALILALAADRSRLAAIRAKLASNRLAQPLFDTQGYARSFETGLDRAYEIYCSGQSPRDIRVEG